jgi:hypothetical protein
MPMHPISANRSGLFFSLFLSRVIEKYYLHISKWGLILKYPSHNTTKAAMCCIPLGFGCHSLIL